VNAAEVGRLVCTSAQGIYTLQKLAKSKATACCCVLLSQSLVCCCTSTVARHTIQCCADDLGGPLCPPTASTQRSTICLVINGLTACRGERTCINLASSATNCGACGKACLPGEDCCNSACVNPATAYSMDPNCGGCRITCRGTIPP
jgi:hypothetical protein